ncbi:hypothetical protein MMC25_000794 [Agyrium rufum]|nr:hypothetical protein [Agyrium rufum]
MAEKNHACMPPVPPETNAHSIPMTILLHENDSNRQEEDMELTVGEEKNPNATEAVEFHNEVVVYPNGFKLAIIVSCLTSSVFLDETILATAIPHITDQFNSLDDVGCFLATCSFQLTYGKLYIFFPIKWVFFIAIAIFEVGSLVCATSPNSDVLIVGRAIAGLGSAALTLAAIGFFFKSLAKQRASGLTLREKSQQLDVLGLVTIIIAIASLLLALRWGGSRYPWGNARIVALLALFSILTVAFVLIQIWKQEKATVPPRMFKKRSVVFSAWHVFCAGAAMNVLEYFIPIWFQAIQGVNALESGIRILPTIFGVVVFSFVAGFGVSRFGCYTPFMIAGSMVLSIGTGLITKWKPLTGAGEWTGYQFLLGAGGGLAIQQAHSAAQTVLSNADVPTGAVVIIFAQILGGTLFISVADAVFTNRPQYLTQVLDAYNAAVTTTFYVAVALAAASMMGALGTEWRSVKGRHDDSSEE